MWKLLFLALIQSVSLAAGQVILKISMQQIPPFAFTAHWFGKLLGNGWFALCGLCFVFASVLWMYIVKHYPFSMAYPLVSLSYIMGILAAVFVFHEHVSTVRWIGVALILSGVLLVVQD